MGEPDEIALTIDHHKSGNVLDGSTRDLVGTDVYRILIVPLCIPELVITLEARLHHHAYIVEGESEIGHLVAVDSHGDLRGGILDGEPRLYHARYRTQR